MTQIYARPVIPPMHEGSSSYGHRSVEDSHSLRGFHKADDYSPHPQPCERSTWKPRSPMSELQKLAYEAPPSKAGDMCQARPEIPQNQTREQLPPLSSLFGSSSHQSRPPQTSYPDRQSPIFPAGSPLEARYPATPVHPERPYEGSYYQRPGSTRPYSYNSIPTPPRHVQSGGRPESPRYETSYGAAEASRTQQSLPGWSPRSQSSRPEYFSRDTSSSFRPHSEHRPHPPQTHRPDSDARPAYRDPPQHTPVIPNYPPPPASTVAGDPATTKDGLGPKIWTGTQFLPRFVRQADVPGEGVCYFYDDGTHCKTVIDGEIVNAHWGVTKAGKPRKRLAIACITCREKKIKCDPDYPRCVQCEKFGRVCKFKNAPRGGQGSPDTPPADPEDIAPRPVSSRADLESFKVEQRDSSQSVSPRQALRRATPDSETHPPKRQRTGYTDFTPVASDASPRPSILEATSPSKPWIEPVVASPIDHNLLRDWQINPYTTHPALVTELMSVFFKHVPDTAFSMFPEVPFKVWVLSPSEKSLDDLMLIYTILALGTVFSPKLEHRALGAQYASICRYACDNRHFSIQLVQSRLILAIYYFAINNPNDSWDFCGGALRAASGLRLNVEFEQSDDALLKTFPYGLNRHGYAECRRRTFWSCYLMDRFDGFCSGHFSGIHPKDIFLRLPCDAKSFESQAEVQNPYFDDSTPPIQNTTWSIGSTAYLINICTILGDVMANIYRTSQRPPATSSKAAFTKFYENQTHRLRAWKDSLPSCYQFSAESLKRAADTGKLGTYLTMHTMYHTTVMKLNRYVQHSGLTSAQITHHVSIAQQHAKMILVVMDTLAARRSPSPANPGELCSSSGNKFFSPYLGYSIISAIDILTVRVSLEALPTYLHSFVGAQSILDDLAFSWQSARTQQALVLQRFHDLAELSAAKDHGGAGALGLKLGNLSNVGREVGDGTFEMREAIEKTFPREYDCVYA